MAVTPSAHYGRSTRRFKAIAAQVKQAGRQNQTPCVECGQPIDYDLDPNHRDAYTTAHKLSVRDHPELAEDPSNIKGPAHRHCNAAAGASPGGLLELGPTTRAW